MGLVLRESLLWSKNCFTSEKPLFWVQAAKNPYFNIHFEEDWKSIIYDSVHKVGEMKLSISSPIYWISQICSIFLPQQFKGVWGHGHLKIVPLQNIPIQQSFKEEKGARTVGTSKLCIDTFWVLAGDRNKFLSTYFSSLMVYPKKSST